jgi:hypothetical protein
LKGTFLSDGAGNISVAYCPVAFEESTAEIQDNIFYCVVQSQGLPGFFRAHPTMGVNTRSWAKKLLSFIKCKELKTDESIFDIDFANTSTSCSN